MEYLQPQNQPRRVLIASANPLFGKGLRKLFEDRWGTNVEVIGLTSSMLETINMLEKMEPDLVILDYDDETLNRGEFLSHFMSGERTMQVMLVSLKSSGAVVVYDRKSLTPSEAEDWLNLPWQTASRTQPIGPKRRSNMRHFIIIAILVVISTFLVNTFLTTSGILPVEASAQALPIDRLFNVHFFLISFLFSLIVIFIVYSLIFFRRKNGENTAGASFKGNTRLEILWMIIPLGTVLYLSFLGSQTLSDIRRIDPQALQVNVTAGQWYWSFEYPSLGITSQSLQLPVNRQVLLRMTSKDVIHSFWVPEFYVKQDILPGKNLVKELRITPTLIGNFKVRCAEFCGGNHAGMEAPVAVLSEANFNNWVQQQKAAASSDPLARGKVVAAMCTGCHTIDGGKGAGPTWKGLYGSEVDLESGQSVLADDAYLMKSILDPNADIVKGFSPGMMPQNYSKTLTDQQIQDVIAFIKSLK